MVEPRVTDRTGALDYVDGEVALWNVVKAVPLRHLHAVNKIRA